MGGAIAIMGRWETAYGKPRHTHENTVVVVVKDMEFMRMCAAFF
jgi:hypothetical protein